MPQALQPFADAISGIFDSPVVQLGLRAIAIYIVVLWLAASYWAFRDMELRTSNPLLPYFAASLIIVFTPVFFPFGVLAYRIVRPQEKIGEVYERTLAEEALLAEVEAVHSCPTCARRVNDEWIICPTCRTRLNRVCPNCSRLVGLDWSLCAWCGRDFERAAQGFDPQPARDAAPARPAPIDRPPVLPPALAPGVPNAPARAQVSGATRIGNPSAPAQSAQTPPARALDRVPAPPSASRAPSVNLSAVRGRRPSTDSGSTPRASGRRPGDG